MGTSTYSGTAESGQQVAALCEVEGCERVAFARRMCGLHYKRWHRHGDPLKARYQAPNGAAKAWLDAALATETDECLPYPYAKHKGKGALRHNGRTWQASRYVLVAATGEDPPHLEAAHNCRTPSCCNKRHLRWDTHAGNMADTVKDGTSTRGEKNGQSVLREADVRAIKGELAKGAICRVVAESFGVHPMTVHAIKQGRTWGWVS